MSAGYAVSYYPVKSFNGANNWKFGWYSDRQISVNPSQDGQVVTLATFVDYGKSNKDSPVLIQVGTDTYLQYNRAKDFNYQAQQCIDQITIVQQQSIGSALLGCIDQSSSQFAISNFNGSGRTVVLSVCGRGTGSNSNPDWMSVSIGYDQSYCSAVKPPIPATRSPLPPTPVPTLLTQTGNPTTRIATRPQPTPGPTLTLNLPFPAQPSSSSCYDGADSLFLVDGVNRSCAWLRGRPTFQPQLCTRPKIRGLCPRTCQVCSSSCTDLVGSFSTPRARRTCVWLSQRPYQVVSGYCSRTDVASLCLVTCQTCP